MKKQILIVYPYLAHYRAPIFDHLLDARPGSSFEFSVATGILSELPGLKVIDDTSALFQKHRPRWKQVKNIWFRKRLLWQVGVLKELFFRPYDGVIFLGNVYYLSTWISALVCQCLKQPVLMWTHGILKKESGLKAFVRRRFYNLSSGGLLLYNHRSKNLMSAAGLKRKKLTVVYNSLDYDTQKRYFYRYLKRPLGHLKSELGLPSDQSILIYTGRLTPEKRLDTALDLLCRLNADRKAYILLLVGDGPYADALRRRARFLRIADEVRFTGACYDEQMLAKLIMAAHVMLVPGGIGLTAIHSLSYGTPVVTHSRLNAHKPEHEVIQDGISGSFIDLEDVATLKRTVDHWTRQKEAHRRRLAIRCRKNIDTFYNPYRQRAAIERALEDAFKDISALTNSAVDTAQQGVAKRPCTGTRFRAAPACLPSVPREAKG
ncbi:MAG: glycosyltransferase family 4 protein [Desulfosarcinaceae bacterium]|nr:glycosyltransferase family 4 protein [Desulfosarcinaceae bacterium]